MMNTLEQLTLGAEADADTDEAWEEEIQARIRAVDAGRVTGIPWGQVLLEAERRLTS